jgi:membrane protease YdiL (CAAX protease family)
MPQAPPDPVLNAFIGTVWLASMATWGWLIVARARGPWLAYEPRNPVPWGPAAAVLAVLFTLLALASAGYTLVAGPIPPEPGPHDVSRIAERLILALVPQVLVIALVFIMVVVTSGATRRDLGLPSSWRQLRRDIFIGAVACLAALLPVQLIQVGLLHLFKLENEPSGHELVKMVTSGEPSWLVLWLAGLAAVAVAPFCEEITFRLLLQGWLEKCEDVMLERRMPRAASANIGAIEGPQNLEINDESPTTDEIQLIPDDAVTDDSSFVIRHSTFATQPPERGLARLPYGTIPILISSALFGLAHIGYGPEPIPLFFLALALGYVYQRTHRILPCMVAHALFNGFTMVVLWRLVFHAAK